MIPEQTTLNISTESWWYFLTTDSFLSFCTLVAIILSPIIALRVTAALDKRNEATKRKLELFRSLMKTRNAIFDAEHVHALNLIEVEFYGVEPVLSAFTTYIESRRPNEPTEKTAYDRYVEDGQRKRIDLIYQMSVNLGYKYDKKEIEDNAFFPLRWQLTTELAEANAVAINKLLTGKTRLPISIVRDDDVPR